LFIGRFNRPLNRDTLRQVIASLGEKADVKNCHPHRFRHTMAITYLRSGGDVFTLQSLLGHSTLDMVQHYARIAEVDVEQARAYAQSLPVHFVILSNGNDHYFWDYADGDARPVLGLPTQADLERRANLKQHRQGDLVQSLASVPYPTRLRFKGDEIAPHPYQLDCLRAADAALAAASPPTSTRCKPRRMPSARRNSPRRKNLLG
jgi:hypothetical protein